MLISNNNFLINKVPDFHPLDPERLIWWKIHKRYIFEGYWSGGKWMPPSLYHYVNFWHILLNEEGETSKTKVLSRPFLRDIEWEKSYYLEEAKGFSGFTDDEKNTCHRGMAKENIEITKELEPKIYNKYKDRKYIHAREYLRMNHGTSKGKAKYENQTQNIIDIEARGGGKSYFASSLIGLNFTTDGANDYDIYLEKLQQKTPFSSETLVGAYDSKWSMDLLKKVQLGFANYPGANQSGNKQYPSPLSRKYMGSWESGKTIIAEYEQKIGGLWQRKGTRSKIQHRTFKDNHLAANGTRGNLNFIDEVGFMANLTKAWGAIKECLLDGDEQFGVIWCMGTGGDMEGGSTLEAKKVFYSPEDYNCLVFDDIYEHRGKIGMFVPAHKTLNKYRDTEGILDSNRAKKAIQIRRDKASIAKDRRVYIDELQNKPEKPSEAFLTEEGTILDIIAIEEQQHYIESMQHHSEIRGMYGDIVPSQSGKMKFIRDTKNKLRPADFPVEKGKQPDGCVVIWELPEIEVPPYGMYIAGTDPYDQDKALNTVSMGSTLIMKRFDLNGVRHERIVAEYTGRPRLASIHHENVRKLLKFYNALDLYENEKNTIKMHFQHKNSLYLLADTPTVLSKVDVTNVRNVASSRSNKGIHMTQGQKDEMLEYLKEWLETETIEGGGKTNLHNIKSVPLLKELAAYNDDGNFDRAIAMLLLVLQNNQMYRIKGKKDKENKKRDHFLTLLDRNKNSNIPRGYGFDEEDDTFLNKRKAEGKGFFIPNLLN